MNTILSQIYGILPQIPQYNIYFPVFRNISYLKYMSFNCVRILTFIHPAHFEGFSLLWPENKRF